MLLQVTQSEAERLRRAVRKVERTATPRIPQTGRRGGGNVSITGGGSTGDRAVRIVEAVESDPDLGPHLKCRLLQAIGPTVENPLVQYADATAQIVNVTIGGTITNQTFTISIGGNLGATFTANNSTADQVRDGLIASWNTGTLSTFSTASNGGAGIVTLTATPDDLEYTLNSPGGGATFEQETVSDFVAFPDLAWMEAPYSQGSPLADTYPVGNKFWLKRLGAVQVVHSVPVGFTGVVTVLQAYVLGPDDCIESFVESDLTYCNGQLVSVL